MSTKNFSVTSYIVLEWLVHLLINVMLQYTSDVLHLTFILFFKGVTRLLICNTAALDYFVPIRFTRSSGPIRYISFPLSAPVG